MKIILKKMIRTILLTAMIENYNFHLNGKSNNGLSIIRFAFVYFFLLSLPFSNEALSQSFIQVRQKAISSDFTYDTLGATTSNFKTTAL